MVAGRSFILLGMDLTRVTKGPVFRDDDFKTSLLTVIFHLTVWISVLSEQFVINDCEVKTHIPGIVA